MKRVQIDREVQMDMLTGAAASVVPVWSAVSMAQFSREYERCVDRVEAMGARARQPEAFPGMSDAELFTIGVRCALEWLKGRNVSPVRGFPSLSRDLIHVELIYASAIGRYPDRVQARFAGGITACLRWVLGHAKAIVYPDALA